jgi:hypothetical protein
MPVPRRKSRATAGSITTMLSNLLDINYIFTQTKTILYWGWTPMVLAIGLYTEPRPSWIDLINLWE